MLPNILFFQFVKIEDLKGLFELKSYSIRRKWWKSALRNSEYSTWPQTKNQTTRHCLEIVHQPAGLFLTLKIPPKAELTYA